MARKPTPKTAEPKSWSGLDDVEYDEDEDGAQPIPDDDGNVVLRRSTGKKQPTKERADGRRRSHGNR